MLVTNLIFHRRRDATVIPPDNRPTIGMYGVKYLIIFLTFLSINFLI